MHNTNTLMINEIFYSIQGESYLAGLPFIFVRLMGCDQRCIYCDTKYAYDEGQRMTFTEIFAAIKKYPCRRILVTGGEPLLQANTPLLLQALLDDNYEVSLETSGQFDISRVPRGVVKVMDIKTPASGESAKNNAANIDFLSAHDEIKFVVMNEGDILWSLDHIRKNRLDERTHVSLSPTDHVLLPLIAERVLDSGLKVRQQIQLHKLIWPDRNRGV